ncbi:MAG: hypothetical protein NWP79_03690 [Paracoccaceae bacterium]|nr:hypothetical protein [Paracoccaceae bacterium]
MTLTDHQAQTPHQSLKQVLQNTSLCLEGIVVAIKTLEQEILLSHAQSKPCQTTGAKLQSVDFVTQSLEETKRLLERIADDLPTGLSVDLDRVIAPIKLQKLRDQIVARPKQGYDIYNHSLEADVELF